METTRIVFVLFPKVHLQDIAGPAQVFYESAELGTGNFRLHFISCGGEVESSQGVTLKTPSSLNDISLKKGDLVCVPGFDYKSFVAGALDRAIDEARDWINAQYRKGAYVASICSGALALGRYGLLDGRECTSHWKCISYMKRHFPEAKVLENRLYVFDGQICTSAGMTSGIDMTLALVEQWRNPLLAAKVAQEMVINVRREHTQDQKNIFLDFTNHFNADIYRAQEILANRLDASFTIDDLAREVHMSSRHLSRLFKIHSGQTVQGYRDSLRIEHGEKLLLNTQMSVKEIAQACGFEDSRQFTRLWKKRKFCTPNEYRHRYHPNGASITQ